MKTITSISAALVLALGASGIAQADDASETLYRYRPAPKGVTIWSDGQGGPISQFQSALRDKLSAAGVPASELPVADGSYGPKTSSALRRLFTLPGFSDMAPSVGSEPRISAALWNRLLPGRPLPSS